MTSNANDLPAAVVFDMDGVLVDTEEPFWRQVERLVFAEHGLTITDDDCRQTKGWRLDRVVAHWAKRANWSPCECADIQTAILNGMVTAVRASAHPLPGVADSLAQIRSDGVRLALATSSPSVLMNAVLQALDLEAAFEHCHSAEHEAHGKPAPDVYLSAAASLKLAPKDCWAVEDSLAGIRSARAAGMYVIGVPEPQESVQVSSEAHRFLSSLERWSEIWPKTNHSVIAAR